MAENGDIKIEVTRPEELSKIARLVATAADGEATPPKLRRLVKLVGTRVGPDELGELAASDSKFAELLGDVLHESVAVNGDNNTVVGRSFFTWIRNGSRKRKVTFVFLFVVITVGAGGGLFQLMPDRGTADQPIEADKANIADSPPSSNSPANPPAGSTLPLPPVLAPPINQPVGNNPVPKLGPTNGGPTQPQAAPPQLATTLSQARGLPGVYVNFYGTGYQGCPGARTVTILWDGAATGETAQIEPDGRFGARVAVPENSSVGEHHFYGQCAGDAGLRAQATYTVSPPLVVTGSPSKLRAGQVLTVRGTNFDGCPDYGDRTVNLSVDALGLSTTAPIKADGTVEARFTVPQGTASNDYYMTGQCRDGGQWVRGIFTVQP